MQEAKVLGSLLLALVAFKHLLQVDAATNTSYSKKGITITFLLDTTFSMGDEIYQVKNAIHKIYNFMKKNHPDEIANYALLEFKDPDVKVLTVTTDPEEFCRSLDDIELSTGGDCPEVAMKGLKIALENSLPYSYIYVFTDANAKDYKNVSEIEDIIQRKRSKVVFVLTGNCTFTTDPDYQVYYYIAKVSNGHAFKLNKNEVYKVLEYLKHDVGIKSVVNSGDLSSGTTTIKTPVDVSMIELTFTVVGDNPNIVMKDPTGRRTKGKTILKLDSATSKLFKNLKPGNWTVEVSTDSPGHYVVTTASNFFYTFGFSLNAAGDVAETSSRPLIGEESTLLIDITNGTNSVKFAEVKIKDTNNKLIQTIKLLPVPDKNGTYKTEKFLPPSSMFFLEFHGSDSKNNSLIRISDSAISVQNKAPPIIYLEKEVTATLKLPFTLVCHIESIKPFLGSWSQGGTVIVPEKEYSQSTIIEYYMNTTTSSSGGVYTCKAENIAGVVTKEVKLKIEGPPPSVTTPNTTELMVNQPGNIPCTVESDVDYTVKWEKFTNRGKYKNITDSRFTFVDGNLVISTVKSSDEGVYKCSVNSSHGVGSSTVKLEIAKPLQVTVSEDQTFQVNQAVQLVCNGSGTLPIKFMWRKNGIDIEELDKRLYAPNKNTLILNFNVSDRTDEGEYECQATDKTTSVTKTTKLQYVEEPVVEIRRSISSALAGTTHFLDCLVKGVPKPIISWRKDGDEVESGEFIKVLGNGTISFLILLKNHSGEYQCFAENEIGKSDKKVNLNVISEPNIENENEIVEEIAISGQTKELTCKVINGEPPIKFTWFKDGEKLSVEDMKYLEAEIYGNGSLILPFIRVDNEGTYECEAKNFAGKATKLQNVIVHEPPRFADDLHAIIRTLSEVNVALPCKVNGKPKPKVKWMKDNKPLIFFSNVRNISLVAVRRGRRGRRRIAHISVHIYKRTLKF